MNKKGSWQSLSVIALLVVSFLAYFSLTPAFADFFSDSTDKTICQLSFISSAQAKKIGLADDNKFKCPKEYINITDGMLEQEKSSVENYIKEYKGEQFFFKDEQSIKEHAMNKMIAKQMISAWKQSGEGRFDVFENEWSWGLLGVPTQRPLNCVIFSRFKFDEKIQQEYKGKEIISINEWLSNNYLEKDGESISYIDYLANDGQPSMFNPYYTYKTDDMLAVVYVRINLYAKEEWIDKNWKKIAGGTGVAAATVFSGGTVLLALPLAAGAASIAPSTTYDALHPPPRSKSFISLMPYSIVNEVCIIKNP